MHPSPTPARPRAQTSCHAPSVRAVVCQEFAPIDRLVIEERPDPQPGPGKVVVAVRAAGVNFVDGLFVQGKYQIKPPLPFTPGGEVAGDVVAIGEGVDGHRRRRPGARHAVAGRLRLARRAARRGRGADPRRPHLRPGRRPRAELRHDAVLAHRAARRSRPGEWVLVLGAGGGIGLAAVDVARHLGAPRDRGGLLRGEARGGATRGGRGDDRLRDRGPQDPGPRAVRRRRRRRRRPRGRPLRRPGAPGAAVDGALPRDRVRRRRDPPTAGQPGAAQQPHGGGRRLGGVDDARPGRQPGRCWPS